MRTRFFRRGLPAIILVLIALAVLAGLAALPFIASTQIVKDHLALELSRWSGYRVTLGGSPVIRVWPRMQAVLTDVRFSEWGSDGNPAVLASDIVEIDLSAFAALRGRIEPQRVHFIRPVLRLRLENGEYALPPASAGRFRQAVSVASRLLEEKPADLARLPAEPVGIVEWTEGRIVARGAADGSDRELLSSIAATLRWPTMNRELSFRAGSIWRGESVTVSGSMEAPLALLSGRATPFRIAFESAPLTGSVSGTLSQLFVKGDVSVATPSLGRTLEWLDTPIGAKMPSGAVALSGALSGDLRQMKLDPVQLTLGGSPGSGTLDFAMQREVPAISGTLAFEDLDLVHLLTAYSILPDGSSGPQLSDLLRLDLRLSAVRAAAGPFRLTDVAAVVKLDDRLVTFDISDSTAFGGNVLTGIRIDLQPGQQAAEFRLLADEIDGAALANVANAHPWVPKANGKLSVILKGPLDLPGNFVGHANGSITAVFESGTVGSFDLASFIERAGAGGFFSIGDIASGSIAFDRAEAKVTLTDGVAAIDKATITSGGQVIELGGIADYNQSSIALTGRIRPGDEGSDGGGETSFFAGGSWRSPYFSAILPGPPGD